MWELIPRIYQRNPFMRFVKTYPVSAKFTTTKENKQGTLHMNFLGNSPTLLPIYLVTQSNKIEAYVINLKML